MSIAALEYAMALKRVGEKLRREGLSSRVVDLVAGFDGSYKGAMILAGRLKAIGQAAKYDGYWTEKVDEGFHREMADLKKITRNIA